MAASGATVPAELGSVPAMSGVSISSVASEKALVQWGGTCYAHSSALTILKLIKVKLPELFKIEPGSKDDCSWASENILFPEEQKGDFAHHKPIRRIAERYESYIRKFFGRCKIGTGKFNNIAVYLYLLTKAINQFGEKGHPTAYTMKYLLDFLKTPPPPNRAVESKKLALFPVDERDSEEAYYFPEGERFVFPERMKTPVIKVLRKVQTVLERLPLEVILVDLFTNFTGFVQFNSEIQELLDNGYYACMSIPTSVIELMQSIYKFPVTTDTKLYVAKTTLEILDSPETPIRHAVTLVNINGSKITFKNSWGANWADFGYLTFDLELFELVQRDFIHCSAIVEKKPEENYSYNSGSSVHSNSPRSYGSNGSYGGMRSMRKMRSITRRMRSITRSITRRMRITRRKRSNRRSSRKVKN